MLDSQKKILEIVSRLADTKMVAVESQKPEVSWKMVKSNLVSHLRAGRAASSTIK